MRHRISAGVLVEEDGRILLVRHQKPGAYDFWVAPGGGAEGAEDLRATVRRETREECGLEVAPTTIAYIEELATPDLRTCKIWFTGRIVGGVLSSSRPAAVQEHIVEAAFLGRDELRDRIVFPTVLEHDYWIDRKRGFPGPRYLGIRDMEVGG